MIRIYGIPNCDTVKRARRALSDAAIEHEFHDFRKDGLARERLQSWLDQLGADALVNKRGTTWRKLPPERQNWDDEAELIALLQEQPSLIKRPVFEGPKTLLLGFPGKQADEILQQLKSAAAR